MKHILACPLVSLASVVFYTRGVLEDAGGPGDHPGLGLPPEDPGLGDVLHPVAPDRHPRVEHPALLEGQAPALGQTDVNCPSSVSAWQTSYLYLCPLASNIIYLIMIVCFACFVLKANGSGLTFHEEPGRSALEVHARPLEVDEEGVG